MKLTEQELEFIRTSQAQIKSVEKLGLNTPNAMRVMDHLLTAQQIVIACAAVREAVEIMAPPPAEPEPDSEQNHIAAMKARNLKKFGGRYEENEKNSDSAKARADSQS
ncbi:MAG: hypothetical protein KIS92_02680 [Planctomycetota bacterium]|nr:hypothetical protein [Planctomycetota bacterium]